MIKKITYSVGLAISLICALGAFVASGIIEQNIRLSIGSSLNTVLEITNESLNKWAGVQRQNAVFWAQSKEVKHLTQQLLKEAQQPRALIHSPSQKTLRTFLKPAVTAQRYLGYFIVSKDGINLASSRNNNIGVPNLLIGNKQYPAFWQGHSLVSHPILSDVTLMDAHGVPLKSQVSLFVSAPIFDEKEVLIALLLLRINPEEGYFSILERGRIGQSGETYTVTHEGIMASRSRFNQEIIDMGLLDAGQKNEMKIKLVNPGVDLRVKKRLFSSLENPSTSSYQ